MNFGRLERTAAPQPMSEINMTPLVDVMLVLLVIFIVATPLMAGRLALELPKADASAVLSPTPEAVFIALDAAGQTFWGDQVVDVTTLDQRLRETAQRDPTTEIQLRADTAVPYGRVVQLIGLAQAAGLSRIGFVAERAAPAPAR